MKLQSVNLITLLASEQPRPLVTEDVDRMAASIKALGLIQPITVRPHAVLDGGLSEAGFQIIAGHHRVAACRTLGWAEIDAIVIDAAEHLQAELIEIDENLCRSELTGLQRSSYTKRRKVIWEAMHPPASQKPEQAKDVLPIEVTPEGEQVRQAVVPVAKHGRTQENEFAAATAAITGENVRSIQRHIARAEALGDDIDRLVGTSLDKGVEADALIKLPESERKELIERAVAGEIVTARAPVAAASHTQAALLAALKAIVSECMDYPPEPPYSHDSYLPAHLLEAARQAVKLAEGGAA